MGARGRPNLGPLLCWAVVFADIGTSVYYVPGILFAQFGSRAALFVGITLVVFLLLTVKYAEVAIRYPQGGGVVTAGADAFNSFVGLLGGLLILVDYFLTSALSALSGLIYLSVVAPDLKNVVVIATVLALIVLAFLNMVGINADAKVTAVIAAIAVTSQLAVVIAVLLHTGVGSAFAGLPKVLSGPPLGGAAFITGYAGAFLAFSGLESISQLSPAMRRPLKRTAPRAMLLVVITVAITSPLLTLWATTLLNPHGVDPNQFISLLGGYAGGPLLQFEVAASAALLLVFASNTAIIGCYHVFLALSRMGFLPSLLQRRNRWRNTPHWAIAAATVVPVAVVIVANGSTSTLGDMYAFGLLGAFSVTCVSLDVVRWRERRTRDPRRAPDQVGPTSLSIFIIGVITSVLVVVAWTTNLVAKPLATLFGGVVTGVGLLIAGGTYLVQRRRGLPGPVPLVHRLDHVLQRRPPRQRPVVVVLHHGARQSEALVIIGLETGPGVSVFFTYFSEPERSGTIVTLREIVDPYLGDDDAHQVFDVLRRRALAAHRRSVQAVYDTVNSRATAIGLLVERLKPLEVIALADDVDVEEAAAGHRRSHARRDGVAIVRITFRSR